jgi:SAM-dependent methyltransferase
MLKKRLISVTARSRPDPPERWRALRSWFETPLGRRFHDAETEVLDGLLPKLFGYHLVLVGAASPDCPIGGSRTLWQCTIDSVSVPHWGRGCIAEPEYLPIASDSVDVVVLSHVLEFCDSPYQVLREVDRVLIPEGHLLVCGFNPLSLWGLRSALHRGGRAPWCGRFLRTGRLRDWFELLGFETRSVEGFFAVPQVTSRPLSQALGLLGRVRPGGTGISSAGYVMLSRKRLSTLTPIRRIWRPARTLASARVAEPTPRSMNGR